MIQPQKAIIKYFRRNISDCCIFKTEISSKVAHHFFLLSQYLANLPETFSFGLKLLFKKNNNPFPLLIEILSCRTLHLLSTAGGQRWVTGPLHKFIPVLLKWSQLSSLVGIHRFLSMVLVPFSLVDMMSNLGAEQLKGRKRQYILEFSCQGLERKQVGIQLLLLRSIVISPSTKHLY